MAGIQGPGHSLLSKPSRAVRANWRPASAPITPTSCRARSLASKMISSPASRAPAAAGHAPRFVRTTNLLERLFVEERRRLKIIPNGFGEKPVLKLMFGALIRAAERWRGLRFTEFELRQIAAVRKDLDDEYQTLITPRAASSQPRISSKSKP